MTAAFRAGAVGVASNGSMTFTVTVPGSVQPGDYGVIVAGADYGNGPAYTAPSGWDPLFGPIVATNTSARAWYKKREAGDPSTVVVTANQAYGNMNVVWFSGSEAPVAGTVGIRSGTVATTVAPAITVAANCLVVAMAGDRSIANTVGEQGAPSVSPGTLRFWSEGVMTLTTGSGINTFAVSDRSVAAGSSGTATFTYPDSATNAWAVQIAFPDAVVPSQSGLSVADGLGRPAELFYKTATGVAVPQNLGVMRRGFSSIDQVLATPGFTMGHRGNSTRYPEMSLHSYTQTVRRGYGLLEVSVHRSSDGVFFGLHDDTLTRTSPTAPATSVSGLTWTQIQAYLNTLGSHGSPAPYMTLDDYIAAYGHTHVTFYDPKDMITSDRLALFQKLKDEVGVDRAVIKSYGDWNGMSASAQAYGFKTWGYYYATNFDGNTFDRYQASWDILGLNYEAAQSYWDQIIVAAGGRKVIAHIAATQANYNTAISKGADGVQCSGSHVIAPVSWWN